MAPFSDLRLIHLMPEDFPDYLTRTIGFRTVRTLNVAESIQGFDRPIYVLVKPDRPDGRCRLSTRADPLQGNAQ